MRGPVAQLPAIFSFIVKWINPWTFFFISKVIKLIYMKDAECAETNEKSILRFLQFLDFEMWSFLYWNVVHFWWIVNANSTIIQKIKIGKIWKLIIHSIQHCAHLSSKYGHFWGGEGEGVCISLDVKTPLKLIWRQAADQSHVSQVTGFDGSCAGETNNCQCRDLGECILVSD